MSKLRNKSHLSSAPGCDFDSLVEISRAVVEICSECSQMKFLSVRSRRLVECFFFVTFILHHLVKVLLRGIRRIFANVRNVLCLPVFRMLLFLPTIA